MPWPLLLLVTPLVLRLWVLEPVEVPSSSMTPTLLPGEHLLVDRLLPHLTGWHRGDVVVFSAPDDGRLTVKRVVGLPGDDVEVVDGVLHIDGVPVPEPWVDPDTVDGVYDDLGTVPSGHVTVLGDNRFDSVDSRRFGAVPVEDLEGRAVARVWPLDRAGALP